MDVLIPIETSSREMIYKIYLCHHLALKGLHCYLGRKSYINYLINNLKGYIYIDKGYHKGNSEKIYEAVKDNGGIIVSLDEEGGIDYSDGSTLLGRYSKELFDNVDLTFLWGSNQFELVKENINKDIMILKRLFIFHFCKINKLKNPTSKEIRVNDKLNL